VHRVTAVVVSWNSGEDLANLVRDLHAQTGVALSIVVVDNASRDDSVALARAVGKFALVEPGRNLGYTGGNRVGADAAGPDADVFIVSVLAAHVVADDAEVRREPLHADAGLAAVAPLIELEDGNIEYLDSVVDLHHARAVHVATDVPAPAPGPPVALSWIDGAAWLFRAQARGEVGLFDDRFFLLFEEVDWCIRARAAGWRVALVPEARVGHRRSSSFAGTNKSGYYYWRNLYLLCRLHAPSPLWRLHYARRVARHLASPVVRRGVRDALRGRYGPGPEDAAA